MKFTFQKLDIPEVILVKCETFQDSRGSFSEVYKADEFEARNIGPFVQENYSCSVRNVVRGLHYQEAPMGVGKLVSCPHGAIYDVAVDIRKDSPTYGKWTAVFLENGDAMVWVPEGFAHGFCVLSGTANVLYRLTQYYSKNHDKGLRWNDPDIGITWPVNNPIVSEKDSNAPLLWEI
jgi:dTDP-4-dehydrorhamnose 3,5-epimerase